MGNVIQGLNQDGQNSGTFLGNYHNVGSTTTNFTGTNVNFTGTNQNVNFTGTGQQVVFGATGGTAKVTYWNSPSFMTGASFPDGTLVKVGSSNISLLDSTGKINSSLLSASTNSSTVNTLTVNQTVSGTGSINLQGSITGANLYGSNLYGNVILQPTQFIFGGGKINIGGTISTNSSNNKAIEASEGGIYAKNSFETPGIFKTATGSFTGPNYWVGNQMTGPGSINIDGTLNADKIIIKGTGGNIDLQNTGDYIRINSGQKASSGIAIYNGLSVNDGAGLAVGTWSPPGIGNITATGTVSAASFTGSSFTGSSFTGSNYYLGTQMTGPGLINISGNITSGSITTNGNIQGNNVLIKNNNITFSPNQDKGLIYTGTGLDNWTASPFKPTDGMMLYGWQDGALGTASGGLRGSLLWDNNGNVNVRGALKANSSKVAASAPVGGLRVEGQNQWVIGENSTGQLCFYQGFSSNTPFACITPTGNLVAGSG